jgi:hypothetical protein
MKEVAGLCSIFLVPIAQQAMQTAVLDRLSHSNVCVSGGNYTYNTPPPRFQSCTPANSQVTKSGHNHSYMMKILVPFLIARLRLKGGGILFGWHTASAEMAKLGLKEERGRGGGG